MIAFAERRSDAMEKEREAQVNDTKPKTRRQLIEVARESALAGNWSEAVEINRQLLERTPRDAEAQNRLGRALLELKDPAGALEAYTAAMKIDPANIIARRNLQRLELLRHQSTSKKKTKQDDGGNHDIPRTTVFIEEVGKTWVDELVNPLSMLELADVSSGEQLEISVKNKRMYVSRHGGKRLGEVEVKTAERLIELMAKGNRYEAYALGLSGNSLRIILREVYRDSAKTNIVSFPRQVSATRAYLRERDLLRQRDETDFLFADDDDEELDEEEASAEPGEEDESAEPDTDNFIEEAVAVDDEEQHI
jgi:tetratricopeptide (TPR) repeat protein